MIHRFLDKQTSIRNKFLISILSICFITMLTSGMVALASVHLSIYLKTQNNLNITTQKIAEGAYRYSQSESMDNMDVFFQTLSIEPYLDSVCHYNTAGYLIHSWAGEEYQCPESYTQRMATVKQDLTHVFKDIAVAYNQGRIVIQYDIDENVDAIYHQAFIYGIAISIALLMAYILTDKIASFINRPIYHLSGLATTLAEKPNYSLRAKKFSNDELGLLSDAFNAMIIGMGDAQHIADKANNQKSAFLATMSHEIRTPINGIIGTTDLLGETALTGRQKEYVHIIEKSAQMLLELINDILDFSKIEAEKLKIESVSFDLIQHIQDVMDMLQITVSSKGLKLYFKNNLHGQHHVMGDPTRIKQILMNLVSNAIKFTHDGSVTITIEEDQTSAKDIKQILFAVEDTGIGIPADRQESIFDSFSQADESTTRNYGGTGLGLTICKKLVEMMNGTIGVQSIEGTGSTFWFSIPMPIAEKPIEDSETSPTNSIVHDEKIMLVEDNETNIMITNAMLENMGYDVTLCRNGEEAVEAYKNTHIPLILMDCQMPIMDGWQATEAIRAHEAKNNISPARIVALTANAMHGDDQKCFDAGMDDYLSKPFKKTDLINKLSKA